MLVPFRVDVIIPRVFRIGVTVGLRMWSMSEIIRRGVCDVWRIMDFGRRPLSDQPETQMRENFPDDLRIFDEADDAHGAFTFRTD